MGLFFGTLKTELVYLENCTTRAEARLSVFDYIEAFYNSIRLQERLGYLSPNDFEFLRKNSVISRSCVSSAAGRGHASRSQSLYTN